MTQHVYWVLERVFWNLNFMLSLSPRLEALSSAVDCASSIQLP